MMMTGRERYAYTTSTSASGASSGLDEPESQTALGSKQPKMVLMIVLIKYTFNPEKFH